MQNAAPPPRQSLLFYFIQEGGPVAFALLCFSLFMVVWGLFNLAFVRNRYILATQAILSLTPAFFVCMGLIHLLVYAHQLFNTPGPGDPIKVAQLIGHSLILGVVGTSATVVPTFIGIVALAKNLGRPSQPSLG